MKHHQKQYNAVPHNVMFCISPAGSSTPFRGCQQKCHQPVSHLLHCGEGMYIRHARKWYHHMHFTDICSTQSRVYYL